MDYVLRFMYDFILLFLLCYLVHYVFLNKNKKDYSKLKKNDEVKIFIARYNLDVRKTSYKKILNIVTLINSFIISFTAVLIVYIDGFVWKILVSFVVIFALIYSLFEVVGRYLKSCENKITVENEVVDNKKKTRKKEGKKNV